MARPREFDVAQTMDRVMRAFWARGFEATSIDDLCAASNLSKSSLYAAFGDKQALLRRSIERYTAMRVAQVRGVLLGADTLREGLRALGDRMVDEIVAGPGRNGCFLGNCAAEISRGDETSAALVRQGLQAMRGVFREALERAQARGELAKATDVETLSMVLLISSQGLRLVGKVVTDPDVLRKSAEAMLRSVADPPLRRA